MAKISTNKDALSPFQITSTINLLTEAGYWGSPFLNPDYGKVEPPAQYRIHGFLTYANGTDWNPGSGEGYYYYNLVNTWIKI